MFFFLPTGSTAETSRRPVVTIVLAALCVALFVWTGLLEGHAPTQFSFPEAMAYAQDRPWLVEEDYEGPLPSSTELAVEQKEFERLVALGVDRQGGAERALSLVPARGFAQVGWLTNLFVHFDLFHLLGNMLFLWLVGPLLEEAWGRRRFLAFYLVAGLTASLVQFLISRGSPASIGGASGAIAGCMGAFALRFAATKIRFHYFIWFLRIFVGSVHVPAWICGALWFGRELLDLKGGGASGVATGAHVGGFMLGGLVALGMKALGSEKDLLTVAESDEVRGRREGLIADAMAALARGDGEGAREALIALQKEAPDYPGLPLLQAEADVRAQRGVARLERALRPALELRDRQVENTLVRLWPFLDPKGFSQAFAWQLVERLRGARPSVDPDIVQTLLQTVADGTGALAIKARALLEPVRTPEPEAPVAPAPRVVPVTLLGVSPDGLQLGVQGVQKVVPFGSVAAVLGGIVREDGRGVLFVDLVIKVSSGPPTALRLSGTDPGVSTLFPGKPVPDAWRAFIESARRAANVQPGAAPWAEFPSVEALTSSWAQR